MSGLYLYDDARARQFEPFALTRPMSEMRAGTELVRRRWERALGMPATGSVTAPHLADFEELDAPRAVADRVPAGSVLASARFAPTLGRAPNGGERVWLSAGRVAAVRLANDVAVDALDGGRVALEALAPPPAAAQAVEITGWWIDEVWELIGHLNAMLASDIAALGATLDRANSDVLVRLGTHDVVVERDATVEPYVLFDVSAGPVLVRRGAHISAFTRLVGPCAIGEGSTVAGGRVASSSIGEQCKVHGELSTSIFLGHANKSHDGFVGHSYLGRWVNLGAGTVTSNLKNTYGNVALWTPEGIRETNMQFLGTLFGDHAKTAIGTRLTTGSVIGAGANVFGPATAPKVVPPFAWGGGIESDGASYTLDKFLVVAERMMGRRKVPLGDRARRQLAAAHERRWGFGT